MHVLTGIGVATLGCTVATSVVTFGMYAWDKRAATRQGQRVSEKTLLFWSALGGWPGGIVAGKLFRHKTIKPSYRRKFAIAIAIHVLLIGLVAYLFMR